MTSSHIATAPPIIEIEELALICQRAKKEGKKVVHCHGVFDLIHIGHIRHLQKAKEHGDLLVVTITADHLVNKGPNRPAFNQNLRAEALAALQSVDYVAVNKWPNAVPAISLLRPCFYVKGKDYLDPKSDVKGGIELERMAVVEAGGQLICTDDLCFSSSSLINRYMPRLPEKTRLYLSDLASRYSTKELFSYLDSLKDLNVLVVGETIVDDYHYCHTMGKSGKEPILAARFERKETFAGGILAVANHVAAFAGGVEVVTFLGSDDSYKPFLTKALDPKIQCTFLPLKEGPTIVKRRFVEAYPFQKLFEVYEMGDCEENPESSQLLCETLAERLEHVDAVLVVDYGHGMLSTDAITLLTESSPFLAVNTQINAGNQGFNTISKYPRADFISLSENEIRMDVRKRSRPLQEIATEVAKRHGHPQILITRGKNGSLCYDGEEYFYTVPAFSDSAVDRMGAGDAVFALTSLCARKNIPVDIWGAVGSAVGYQKVQWVGNSESINRTNLYKLLGRVTN